jgi:hypothetical protein
MIWLSFYYANTYFTPPKEWMDNLSSKCGIPTINATFQHKSLVYGGYIGLIYGNYLGVLCSKYLYGNLNEQRLKTGPVKYILRYLVILAIVLPYQIITALVSYKSPLYFVVLFKVFLPSMGICLTVSIFAEMTSRKFNLLVDDKVKETPKGIDDAAALTNKLKLN